MRITQENQAILKRIQTARPMYNHIQWEESHKRNQSYLRNCCEYPLVLRKGLAGQGGMVNFGGDSPTGGAGGDGSGDKLAGYTSGDGSNLKYLLKEGKKIGESYYLVEMATEGRTLTISAYDGDSQRTLELLINEKNHRRLYRESNGDYAVLANRLRVEGDRLTLADNNTLSGSAGPGAGGGGGGRGENDTVSKDGQHVGISVGRDGQAGVKLK